MTYLRLAMGALFLGAALIASWPSSWSDANAHPVSADVAPDFSGATGWINTRPLSREDLRGKVVLVEFWTRGCINCVHVLPHTKALHDKYAADGLVVIGVHTPEYDEERDIAGVQAAVRRFGITWPVVQDNDHRIWNAWGNQYWPAQYLIGRDGRVVYRQVGEGNYDTTEEHVRHLLGKA